MEKQKNFSSYVYSEIKTAGGQLLIFSCTHEEKDVVASFLAEKVRSIEVPSIKEVSVSHGSYGKYTRYKITQHKYAGGGGGYIEVISIADAPDSRCENVIYLYDSEHGGAFVEWQNLADALRAYESFHNSGYDCQKRSFSGLPGFIRWVDCGVLTPWFYAIGEEILHGDYALSPGLEDDPTYRLGKKFIVFLDGYPSVKTCLGTRVYRSETKTPTRCVYFSDGSVWHENNNFSYKYPSPKPLGKSQEWIVRVLREFEKMLSGSSKNFQINLLSGFKFVGKILPDNRKKYTAEGRYMTRVKIKGEEKLREGGVNFVPTAENPDIISYIVEHFSSEGLEVETVEIVEKYILKGGKKWSGVFLSNK